MIRTGEILENPVTGERLRFLKTSRDTGGESVVVDAVVKPGGTVGSGLVHRRQTKHFHVVSGTVGFKLGRRKLEAGPGDLVVVEPGTTHEIWNAGGTPARFIAVVRPALQFEELVATIFALAADRKTNRKGIPRLLRLAVIAHEYSEDVRLPFAPAIVPKAVVALCARVGRLLGCGPTYEPAPAGFAVVER